MIRVVILVGLVAAVCCRSAPTELKALSPEMIDYINEAHTTWKAGENFRGVSVEHVQGLLGWEPELEGPFPTMMKEVEVGASAQQVPDQFDSRTQWPQCAQVIGQVRDQGSCGSCWAFGSVEAMSDRQCIASGGQVNVSLSAEDLLSCCFFCGLGCNGGIIGASYIYYTIFGIVTGGLYNSQQGCRPYSIPACEHHTNGSLPPCTKPVDTPECVKQCEDGYPTAYKQDKYYGQIPYPVGGSEDNMKADIMKNGPITVGFIVYADFPSYKTGVYRYITGAKLGGHAVKIIGWGVEDGTPYWQCVNSWNQDWGDKGFFKILRGKNECEIEKVVLTSLPRL